MKKRLGACLILMAVGLPVVLAAEPLANPKERPSIKAFLHDGFGSRHEKSPAETEQFGRLVGLWHVDIEMATQSGGWAPVEPGLWAWKYTLDGFAVSDLWYQGADRLPRYMAGLGRDYLLTSNRIFNTADKKWHVAWMANGAGTAGGADVGGFTATLEGDDIVMRSADGGGGGIQRVVFSDFSDKSFRWRSEYSTDEGKSWMTVMRMQATRID